MNTSNRCGMCRHTEPVVGDLTKVTCFGAPPQLLVTNGGGLASAYPQNARDQRACAVFAPKDLLMVESDPGKFDVVS